MSTLTDCRFSLDQATAGTQKEKGGLIRCLQPSTEAPLHSGRTTRDVWRTLDEQSLSIGYRVFQVTLCRARTSKSPTAPGCREKDNKPAEGQRLPKGEVQRRRGHDQLANLRRVGANRERLRLSLRSSMEGQPPMNRKNGWSNVHNGGTQKPSRSNFEPRYPLAFFGKEDSDEHHKKY